MKKRSFFNAAFLALTDGILIFAALLLSALLMKISIYTKCFAFCAIFCTVAILILFKSYDFYRTDYLTAREVKISVLLSTAITSVISVLLYIPFINDSSYFAFTGAFFILSSFLLLTKWLIIMRFTLKKYSSQRALFIESDKASSYNVRKLRYTSGLIQTSMYVMIDDTSRREIDALLSLIPTYDCLFVSDNIRTEVRSEIIHKIIFEHKIMFASPEISRACAVFGQFLQFGDIPMVYEKPLGFSKSQRVIKRIFDIVLSVFGLIILSPLFLITSLAVKLDSKGPVFYKQERLTKDMKPFFVYKFRSMRTDAEKNGAVFACENDPRITRVGKIIRAIRVDEMPQLLNILKGDMSFVGPRPERPVFVSEFIKTIPNYPLRYIEKAGLTGYAQVYGKYNTSIDDKTVMDVLYINKASLILDLKLILLTMKIIFIRESTEGVFDLDYEKDIDLSEARRQSLELLFGKEIEKDSAKI